MQLRGGFAAIFWRGKVATFLIVHRKRKLKFSTGLSGLLGALVLPLFSVGGMLLHF